MKKLEEELIEEIRELSLIEKIQTLIEVIDNPVGRRTYPPGLVEIAKSLRDDINYNTPCKGE